MPMPAALAGFVYKIVSGNLVMRKVKAAVQSKIGKVLMNLDNG
jgi:hypothetical protein